MKKHIIFDLDDTISASYDFNQQMFVDTFVPYFPKMTKEEEQYLRDLHYNTRGKAMHLLFEEACKYLKIKKNPLGMVSENEKLHEANINSVQCFEGAEEFFSKLKDNGKILSVCTNRQYGSLNKILKKNKLFKYFDNIISCTDEEHEKPDPYCLLELIKKYDIPKDQYIYFGDSKTDFEFASNAGMDFLIIDQYLNRKQFFKSIVNIFVNEEENNC
ncbi:MAG: HAD family hydrolase [Candidatus Dojkabacteria bacterium]